MEQKTAIHCQDLGKCYRSYRQPFHRVLDLLDVPARGWPDGKRYAENWALRGLSLEIPRGERLGIIGRNGAGKSTLLQLICGRLQPSEGTLAVQGRVQALLELGTGFYPEFTGRENIRSSLAVADTPVEEIPALEEEILEFSELWDVADQPVKTYSSGMYTRLAFATATALKPDILVIDEVFHAGDATFVGKSSERMRRLTEDSGVTVLFVTHSLALIERFCTRAILLEKGQVRFTGLPLDVSRYYSARVREEEEINLMVGQGGLRKRSLMAAGGLKPRSEALFRLMAPAPADAADCRIRSLRLELDGRETAHLAVGGPADTAWTESGRILLDPGHLDWSGPEREDNRFHRNCGGRPGKPGNSPFVLVLPEDTQARQHFLHLETWIQPSLTVSVEMFVEDGYRSIGQLTGTGEWTETTLSLPRLKQPGPLPDGISNDARYGDGSCRIRDCGLMDGQGRERRIFTFGDSLTAWFAVEALEPLTRFVATLCIYHVDTTPMCQIFMPDVETGLTTLQGETRFQIEFSPLRFGEGEYTVTLAVYRECDMGDVQENHAYCVLDRALAFRVEQPEGIRKGYGRFLHPVQWHATRENGR